MANEYEMSPKELKRQADAILAAADAAERDEAAKGEPAARSARKSSRKKAEDPVQDQPRLLTDEEAKKAGGTMKVAEFVRFEKGEGLEKRNDDFASEVANMIK